MLKYAPQEASRQTMQNVESTPQAQSHLDRRAAIKLGALSVALLTPATIALLQLLKEKEASHNPKLKSETGFPRHERIPDAEPLIATDNLVLRRSRTFPAIIDIFRPQEPMTDEAIINNLVLGVSWEYRKRTSVRTLHNNAEIQGQPFVALRNPQTQGATLRYRFDQFETTPQAFPPSLLTIEVEAIAHPEGGVRLTPHIIDNPAEVKDVQLWMGSSFGVKHGTILAALETPEGIQTVTPEPLETATFPGELDRLILRDQPATGVTLISAFPGIPHLRLELESGTGNFDIGSRDWPWYREQRAWQREIILETDQQVYLESAFLKTTQEHPSFHLSLIGP